MDEALRSILEIHARSTYRAAERPSGECAFCDEGSLYVGQPPLRRFKDHLNGLREKVWMHEHPDPGPCCEECAAGYDDRADWPCRTAMAAAAALGIELT